MVFDHPKMAKLKNQYKNISNSAVPEIVLLDRLDEYKTERETIEELFNTVNRNVQKDWLGRLLQADRNQHIGAWFEIMLYGWLKNVHKVEVQPTIERCHPDFLIDIENTKIAIEADAILFSQEDTSNFIVSSQMIDLLKTIKKPYLLNVEMKTYGKRLDNKRLVEQVTNWLEESKFEKMHYFDEFGNRCDIEVVFVTETDNVVVVLDDPWKCVNPDLLKASIQQKAKQHSKLAKTSLPYVIAVFLENHMFSAEQIIETWIGKDQIVIGQEPGKYLRQNDKSGLSFHAQEIQNTGVTGFLVFRNEIEGKSKSRHLKSWYIENPYARNKIDSTIFPVEGNFIVAEKNNLHYSMNWVGQPPEL